MRSSEVSNGDIHCDRRLSRAARSLVVKLLERHFKSSDDKEKNHNDFSHYQALLFQRILRSPIPETCILDPSRDIYVEEEQSTVKIPNPKFSKEAYPVTVLKQRQRQNSSHKPNAWYQCGICGKVFMSQFYLDQHCQSHHHHHRDVQVGNAAERICPARHICEHALNWKVCHQVALHNEPYYGRGSGIDRHVQHDWNVKADSIPCDFSLQKCQLLFTDCGMSDEDALSICDDPILQCHHHDSIFSFHWNDHMDLWESEWNEHATVSHRSVILVGVCLLVGLMFWRYNRPSSRRSSKVSISSAEDQGKRLLQRRQQHKNTRILSRFFFQKQVKKRRERKLD